MTPPTPEAMERAQAFYGFAPGVPDAPTTGTVYSLAAAFDAARATDSAVIHDLTQQNKVQYAQIAALKADLTRIGSLVIFADNLSDTVDHEDPLPPWVTGIVDNVFEAAEIARAALRPLPAPPGERS